MYNYRRLEEQHIHTGGGVPRAHGWSLPFWKVVYMKRYEIRQISQNWYCIYDNVMRAAVIESTSIGIKVYAEILGID